MTSPPHILITAGNIELHSLAIIDGVSDGHLVRFQWNVNHKSPERERAYATA